MMEFPIEIVRPLALINPGIVNNYVAYVEQKSAATAICIGCILGIIMAAVYQLFLRNKR